MLLDLSSLEKALYSLDASLKEYKKNHNDFIRDSCIQRFEYCYELSTKMIKRFLELTSPAADVIDELSFPDLIRKGSEVGLLQTEWPNWKKYRDARNTTSHAYNEIKATEVMAVIPNFFHESQFLLSQLKKRNLSNE